MVGRSAEAIASRNAKSAARTRAVSVSWRPRAPRMRFEHARPDPQLVGEGLAQVALSRDVDGEQGRGLEEHEGQDHQGEQPRLETAAAHRAYLLPISNVRLVGSVGPKPTTWGRGSVRIPAYQTRTSYFPSGRPGSSARPLVVRAK